MCWFLFMKYYQDDRIEEDEMGMAYNIHVGDIRDV